MREQKPVEVAVVGGGCASITAAFELTRPEHRGKYHVTVYQMGWRLGGKGASGRGPSDRIEEHGLHLWMGFYENAFRLLRECYAELGRDPRQCRLADWKDAFSPDPLVGLTDRSRAGEWQHWTAHFPPGSGDPGDPLTERNPFTVTSYLTRIAALLRTLLVSIQKRRGEGDAGPAADGGWGRMLSPEAVTENLFRILKYGQLAAAAGLIEAVGILEAVFAALSRFPERYSDNLILRLIDAIASGTRSQLEGLIEADDELRRLWEIVDLVLAVLRGIFRFGLVTDPRGFDAINEYDWREWLLLNGASQSTVDSAFIRGCYDLLFAYEDGDVSRPRMAAGQALRGAARMFLSYRGALFWKMRAGMGDVVFAPFYEVLKRRGVTFRFFHRLENVKLAPSEALAPGERPYVEALEFDVQAEVEGGREYRPLVDVRALPCWPSRPDYAQLADGERLAREGWDFECHWDRRKVGTKTLRVIDDFDFVVLGVSVGAIPHVCREILARDPRWRTMVHHTKTVATQAFQIWLREDMKELGWTDPPINVSGFVEPFDTWADMRQLISEESWAEEPKAIAYFCSVLPSAGPAERSEATYPAEQHQRVRRNAIRFLNRDVVHLWPKATRPEGGFRWETLLDGDARRSPAKSGESRFDAQFWKANVSPTERYVLSLPGSLNHRISPLDNTYDNLTIAGDWTDCGHNAGCVEAAMMSGRLAAHAISQFPALEDIIGFDHP